MKSVNIEGVSVAVSNTDRYTTDNCPIFEWSIDLDEVIYSQADLFGGHGADLSESAMLETLLAFLGAAGESYRYDGMEGESSHLFPEPVVKWAAENADAISMAQGDLELRIEQARKARETLYNWHGGQGSAFYALASSGICEDHYRLMKELAGCLPQDDEEAQELSDLKEFLENGLNSGLNSGMAMDADETWFAPWHDE